jgi:hypothetical protein
MVATDLWCIKAGPSSGAADSKPRVFQAAYAQNSIADEMIGFS